MKTSFTPEQLKLRRQARRLFTRIGKRIYVTQIRGEEDARFHLHHTNPEWAYMMLGAPNRFGQ